MSHRLKPGAPAGFHPGAKDFDRFVSEHVARGDFARAVAVDDELRELAAEDVIDSLAVAGGAVGYRADGFRFFSYEGPFGVGYLVATLFASKEAPAMDSTDTVDERQLLRIARDSIVAHLEGRKYEPADRPSSVDSKPPNGVFVTLWLKEAGGQELRGCIGRLERVRDTVAEEIAECAVSAAVHDPRFPPVDRHEILRIGIEVSLLSSAEKVQDAAELDPAKYGVIMVSVDGERQATLLPEIDGIETVSQQLSVLYRKAGISPSEKVELFRYTVKKIKE